MDLMRRLRDGEVAVEGDKVVEQVKAYTTGDKGKARADGWVNDFSATTTREEEGRVNQGAPPMLGPGIGIEDHAKAQHQWANRQVNSMNLKREVEQSYDTMQGLWEEEDQVRQQREREKGKGKERIERPLQFQGDGGAMVDDNPELPQYDTRVHLAQSSWEEDFDDASMIVGGHSLGGGQTRRKSLSAQQKEWDMLQDSWDEFEVTAAGLKPKDPSLAQQRQHEASTSSTAHGYSFAQNNPYLLHQRETAFSTSTHHHSHHSPAATTDAAALSSARIESLLQHEADVQTDPQNASAWFSLGLKQQENEREELAISALQRAIELDPTVARGAAHLALAISYTNESRRGAAYEQIDKWIDVIARPGVEGSNKVYANEIAQYRNLFGSALPATSTERHQYLTNLLIRLAQSGTESMIEGGVDADVQVAMGVLFNSSEEYEKAGDCFEAALAVRPDVSLSLSFLESSLVLILLYDFRILYSTTDWERRMRTRARLNWRFNTTMQLSTFNLDTFELVSTSLLPI
jgi:peroxin-5